MLRDKGAPSMTPFPGEQDFEATDVDLDQMGDVLLANNTGIEKPKLPMPEAKKKKKKPASSGRTAEEQESALEFVPADETIQIAGVN